ncbi:GIY-YIG nuclease family protein [Flavobacterium commune]|uniref:Endonuclease n=1 Tax=Flavobacterium commune TaxID=1306519 RepID=A0A1D9PAU4_9FLAO|nr:GIY-YIG nuclease family protein [Flavobacterium commune]AOZ99696.1 endonuclease [Flavobacterium commune]
MKYYVYVLESEIHGRLYKGQTSDIDKRIKEHNLGKTKSTKGYKPWRLVYFEVYETREEVLEREKYFKTGSGRAFLKEKLQKK